MLRVPVWKLQSVTHYGSELDSSVDFGAGALFCHLCACVFRIAVNELIVSAMITVIIVVLILTDGHTLNPKP